MRYFTYSSQQLYNVDICIFQIRKLRGERLYNLPKAKHIENGRMRPERA